MDPDPKAAAKSRAIRAGAGFVSHDPEKIAGKRGTLPGIGVKRIEYQRTRLKLSGRVRTKI